MVTPSGPDSEHQEPDGLEPDDLEPDDLEPGDQELDAAVTRPAPRRGGGAMLGAAMIGLHQVLYGPPKEQTVIEIETSGDPPNLDTDGIDAELGPDHRLVGPPLDAIKSRARRTKHKVRRR